MRRSMRTLAPSGPEETTKQLRSHLDDVAGRRPTLTGSEADLARRIILGLVAFSLLGYTLFLGPKWQPDVDRSLLQTLGWKNAVCFCVMALELSAGITTLYLAFPALDGPQQGYKMLLWPLGVIAWPLNFLPWIAFLAAWTPMPRMQQTAALQGMLRSQSRLQRAAIRALDSRAVGWTLLSLQLLLVLLACAANPATWSNFWQLFNTSKVVHCSLLGLVTFFVMWPFLVWQDAQARRYSGSSWRLFLHAAVPLLGPSTWLAIRPALPLPPARGSK